MRALHNAAIASALLAVVGLTALPSAQANGPELVTNGGFETGDFTGWSKTPFGDLTVVGTDPLQVGFFPHGGNFQAQFASSAPKDDVLSQMLPTVVGENYAISFWLANSNNTPNDFKAFFGQSQLLDLENANGFGYKNYNFLVTATDTSTLLSFAGRQPPVNFVLDDISVTATGPAAVPEASSVVSLGLLLLLGMGCVAVSRRRKASTTR